MTGTLSRVDAAVDAFVSMAEAALPGVQVLDGPLLGELMDAALVVGLADTAGTPGYESDVTRQDGYGRPRYIEAVTIRSMLTLTSGEASLADLRAQAIGHMSALDNALRDMVARDGVWDRCEMTGAIRWTPFQTSGGTTLNAFFTVVGTCLL